MPLLDVSDLSITLRTQRGPARAVRDVSFTLDRGETAGLVGESGSGKTLTALALLGLLPEGAQVTGSIRLEGEELVGASEDRLCDLRGNRIAMVFQEPMTALNPVHPVGRQVAEPLRAHKGLDAAAARKEVIALLDRVGIAEAARRVDQYPHQFSGGQRQRITIAMALACGPDLLVADEPTTALDVMVQQQILGLVRELVRERGMALLLVSHNLGVIADNAARTMVMYGGSVVESGPTRDVFARPRMPYTLGLVAARPRLTTQQLDRLPTIAGTVPDLADLPAGCPFAGRCRYTVDACFVTSPPPEIVGPSHVARCIRLDAVQADLQGAPA
ncbi:ABC transporter ATP-binding protein [Ramlibacter algicola]|uniref:ABC transporter ATP-binding protein n=1 Tax=Ramlibacter algicola TaxID=2795217 RepID=A0A934PZQ7_9BURK|nr:ABC transporter ATP-binding protein [Ramlibacter algicola]MBK0391806.1 ABC transporter ATP-binding protein [Ramlibacter algicola]